MTIQEQKALDYGFASLGVALLSFDLATDSAIMNVLRL